MSEHSPQESWDADTTEDGQVTSNLSKLNVNAPVFIPNINAPAFVPSSAIKGKQNDSVAPGIDICVFNCLFHLS